MKDIFQIRSYKVKGEDKERSEWVKVGVAFPPNKDESVNLQLYLFPECSFQVRDRKKKEDKEDSRSSKNTSSDSVSWDD